jgi:hypothetical protein
VQWRGIVTLTRNFCALLYTLTRCHPTLAPGPYTYTIHFKSNRASGPHNDAHQASLSGSPYLSLWSHPPLRCAWSRPLVRPLCAHLYKRILVNPNLGFILATRHRNSISGKICTHLLEHCAIFGNFPVFRSTWQSCFPTHPSPARVCKAIWTRNARYWLARRRGSRWFYCHELSAFENGQRSLLFSICKAHFPSK